MEMGTQHLQRDAAFQIVPETGYHSAESLATTKGNKHLGEYSQQLLQFLGISQLSYCSGGEDWRSQTSVQWVKPTHLQNASIIQETVFRCHSSIHAKLLCRALALDFHFFPKFYYCKQLEQTFQVKFRAAGTWQTITRCSWQEGSSRSLLPPCPSRLRSLAMLSCCSTCRIQPVMEVTKDQ